MKVFILGAKGLLGEALQKEFFDHDIIAYDHEELDVTDFARLKNEILKLCPDVVINCVAWNDVDGAERNKNQAELLNGLVPAELAKITSETDALLVHYSTDYVFDGAHESGYKEDDAPNPINAYGRSKYLGEVGVKTAALKFYLIRTSRLYGIKPQSPAAKLSFVLMIIEQGRKNKEIKVVNEEPGAFTYVKDLAEATKRLIAERYPYGIYHLTAAGAATWYECAYEAFKYLKIETLLLPTTRKEFARLARVPKHCILLNTKFPKLRDWRTALRDFLDTLK